jgi:hypothetical protein
MVIRRLSRAEFESYNLARGTSWKAIAAFWFYALHGLGRHLEVICGCAFCKARPEAICWPRISLSPGKRPYAVHRGDA